MGETAMQRAQAAWSSRSQGHLPPSGGDGTSDDMEARVKRLEDDSKEIKADLKKLLSDVAEIKGRVSVMPTSLQLFLGIMAVFAASGLLRWFGH